ncbi:MAG: glycosyl hydrolase family 2 [Myxococcales bacterium]|nr:glycosyl hydrolase family 2 [Myxococcales bacterium]
MNFDHQPEEPSYPAKPEQAMMTREKRLTTGREYLLQDEWAICSAKEVNQPGEAISLPGFATDRWIAAKIPATVLAAQVAAGLYPDPYFSMNLHEVPGNNPVSFDVSILPMPPGSPYRAAWWYRKTFTMPEVKADRTFRLRFDGLNFRANVWLNGRRIADAEHTMGAFRVFEFDVTEKLRYGESNCLALEIFPQHVHDLGFNWVDWSPAPPDKNLGIWRDVVLAVSGPVAIRHPHVLTKLNPPALDQARLTIMAELINSRESEVKGVLRGRIGEIEVAQPIELEPLEIRRVELSPAQFPSLAIAAPRVWWPARLGEQPLYELELTVEVAGEISDRQAVKFGIREVTSKLTAAGHRLFFINGKKILIRGGGWSPDLLLRSSPERLEAEIRYALDLGLNTIRIEGKPEVETFYDLCDRHGMLVICGWCCCDHWEFWRTWNSEDHLVARESLRDQIRLLRRHPSLIAWMNGSDNPPPASVEEMYLKVLADENWPNPILSSASAKPTTVTGPSGVKMTGPYEYVPPCYWLQDTERGGAHGFNTETSPGAAIPPVDSLRKMLPPDHLWPIDKHWIYHAGRWWFKTLKIFTRGLEARYGKATGMEDYARKAQLMAYDGHRAMFEAYGRNKYRATGVIQWMLNNPWPSLIWHLYDYYLRPGGSYFGAKKACEMLHVQYSYDDRSVAVVNGHYRDFASLRVLARVFDLTMKEKHREEKTVAVEADGVVRAFFLPEPRDLTTTYFVRLDLFAEDGRPVSENFYWLSTRTARLKWDKAVFRFTPTEREDDLTLLANLLPAKLTVEAKRTAAETVRVRLTNPGPSLAFFVEARLRREAGGDLVLPILWSDNYVSLLPGETRELTASFRARDAGEGALALEIDGWNVPPVKVEL